MLKRYAVLKTYGKQLYDAEHDNLLLTSEEVNVLEPFLRYLEDLNSVTEQLRAEGMNTRSDA